MNFYPDISKQANDVAFSRKTNKVSHRSLTFDNIPVAQTNSQKHLGMQIDNTLNFDEHVSKVLHEFNKTICVFRETCLTQYFQTFTQPHLDYGDISMILISKINYSLFSKMKL